MKYLESRGQFYEARKPVGQPTRYRYYKSETYHGFNRQYYNTPNRASVMLLIAQKKPQVVMLQAWFDVKVVKKTAGKGEVLYDGVGSGISIPINTADFDFDEKYAELKRFAIANCQVLFETKEVHIYMKLAKNQKGLPRLNTILYFGQILDRKPYKKRSR